MDEPQMIQPTESLYIANQDMLTCWNRDHTEIIRIAHDGRIYWKQREVETDEEFRQAMMDLANAMRGK